MKETIDSLGVAVFLVLSIRSTVLAVAAVWARSPVRRNDAYRVLLVLMRAQNVDIHRSCDTGGRSHLPHEESTKHNFEEELPDSRP
jgi:hypothetical protein